MTCPDCHMPFVPSKDDGNINGLVHSHQFPGANTAVPFANQDASQLELSQKFLQDNQISVDIFAVSPAGKESKAEAAAKAARPELSSSFAVGEEADLSRPQGPTGEATGSTAPLRRGDFVGRRGRRA